MHEGIYHWKWKQAVLKAYYQQLQKAAEVTQIRVENHTNSVREVCLWGTNACTPLTTPLAINTTDSKTIEGQNRPQTIVYNPANDLFYCANQQSNTISVINTQGELITTIPLASAQPAQSNNQGPFFVTIQPFQPNSLLGIIGPIGIAINTLSESAEYGTIAVSSPVANEVVFIAVDNTIQRRESVGLRPVDIVFNPVDACYYTANIISGTISKICALGTANNLPVIPGVNALGVNTVNGDLFVHNIADGGITVYDVLGNFKASVGTTDEQRIHFSFHPLSQQMCIIYPQSKTIVHYDSATSSVVAELQIEDTPEITVFNPYDGLMYVGHPETQRATRLNANAEVVDTIPLTGFTSAMAFSSRAAVTAVSDAAANTITIISMQSGPTVSVNTDYYEYREDFQHNPTLISHLKIVASGSDRIHTLALIEKSPTGKEQCQTLSLSNYQSPQNTCNVSEVFDIEGEIIDGQTTWCFKINPKQVVTFLIYHKQFEMYNVLPEKSRISTGVQMSKGIPVSWRDN